MLAPSLTVDWCGAFAIITEFTDMIYLVCPTGIQTVNPWISKQQPSILPEGYLVLGFYLLAHTIIHNFRPTLKTKLLAYLF